MEIFEGRTSLLIVLMTSYETRSVHGALWRAWRGPCSQKMGSPTVDEVRSRTLWLLDIGVFILSVSLRFSFEAGAPIGGSTTASVHFVCGDCRYFVFSIIVLCTRLAPEGGQTGMLHGAPIPGAPPHIHNAYICTCT
jgi:hypothetical protein